MTLREEKVEQQPEQLSSTKALLVGVVAIVISVATVGWAWLLMPEARPLTEPPEGEKTTRDEVGNIYIYDINRRALGLEKREEALRRLQRYGWVDRDAGVAHIPIERASELYLRRARQSRHGREGRRRGAGETRP